MIHAFFFVATKQMAEVDPETLLEWLSMGQGDERDMQLIALEQLCMLLLMSDNVDRCFEMYVLTFSLPLFFINAVKKKKKNSLTNHLAALL